MKSKPKTYKRYVIETTKGNRIDGVYYKTLEQAEYHAPTPSVIWKTWVTEQKIVN